ncbi:MAG: hypothetical protein JW723_07010 [Bacteroidales bacterium]|nr:hypothetical protein [Bacteroidales bacterium]
MSYKLGDKVRSVAHQGIYKIIASKENPKKIAGVGIIPIQDFDYALKRIDGQMKNDFEPYIYVYESMVEKS